MGTIRHVQSLEEGKRVVHCPPMTAFHMCLVFLPDCKVWLQELFEGLGESWLWLMEAFVGITKLCCSGWMQLQKVRVQQFRLG